MQRIIYWQHEFVPCFITSLVLHPHNKCHTSVHNNINDPYNKASTVKLLLASHPWEWENVHLIGFWQLTKVNRINCNVLRNLLPSSSTKTCNLCGFKIFLVSGQHEEIASYYRQTHISSDASLVCHLFSNLHITSSLSDPFCNHVTRPQSESMQTCRLCTTTSHLKAIFSPQNCFLSIKWASSQK